jgi:hypothetical protein
VLTTQSTQAFDLDHIKDAPAMYVYRYTEWVIAIHFFETLVLKNKVSSVASSCGVTAARVQALLTELVHGVSVAARIPFNEKNARETLLQSPQAWRGVLTYIGKTFGTLGKADTLNVNEQSCKALKAHPQAWLAVRNKLRYWSEPDADWPLEKQFQHANRKGAFNQVITDLIAALQLPKHDYPVSLIVTGNVLELHSLMRTITNQYLRETRIAPRLINELPEYLTDGSNRDLIVCENTARYFESGSFRSLATSLDLDAIALGEAFERFINAYAHDKHFQIISESYQLDLDLFAEWWVETSQRLLKLARQNCSESFNVHTSAAPSLRFESENRWNECVGQLKQLVATTSTNQSHALKKRDISDKLLRDVRELYVAVLSANKIDATRRNALIDISDHPAHWLQLVDRFSTVIDKRESLPEAYAIASSLIISIRDVATWNAWRDTLIVYASNNSVVATAAQLNVTPTMVTSRLRRLHRNVLLTLSIENRRKAVLEDLSVQSAWFIAAVDRIVATIAPAPPPADVTTVATIQVKVGKREPVFVEAKEKDVAGLVKLGFTTRLARKLGGYRIFTERDLRTAFDDVGDDLFTWTNLRTPSAQQALKAFFGVLLRSK